MFLTQESRITKSDVKQLLFFDTFQKMVSIWGEQEVGTGEIDIVKLASYLVSDKFQIDTFDYDNQEDIEIYITEYILNGFPIWEYLKISDWTKDMVSKSFKEEVKKEQEELNKVYKCYTCKYFNVKSTSFGIIQKCKNESENKNSRYHLKRRDCFEVKKSCKYYDKIKI